MVKKRLLGIFILLILVFTFVFLLCQHLSIQKANKSCYTELHNTITSLTDYLDSGATEDLSTSINYFLSFKNLYDESSYYSENFSRTLSSVYYHLLYHDLERGDIEQVIHALEILYYDLENPDGYEELRLCIEMFLGMYG